MQSLSQRKEQLGAEPKILYYKYNDKIINLYYKSSNVWKWPMHRFENIHCINVRILNDGPFLKAQK